MTTSPAYQTAQILAHHGLHDPDAITTADMDTAADHAGVNRPETNTDRHAIRTALDTIGNTP